MKAYQSDREFKGLLDMQKNTSPFLLFGQTGIAKQEW